MCKCADGREMSDDGATCTGDLALPSCARADDFQCDNGQCVRFYAVCNGKPDCDDQSDEATDRGAKCGK